MPAPQNVQITPCTLVQHIDTVDTISKGKQIIIIERTYVTSDYIRYVDPTRLFYTCVFIIFLRHI